MYYLNLCCQQEQRHPVFQNSKQICIYYYKKNTKAERTKMRKEEKKIQKCSTYSLFATACNGISMSVRKKSLMPSS